MKNSKKCRKQKLVTEGVRKLAKLTLSDWDCSQARWQVHNAGGALAQISMSVAFIDSPTPGSSQLFFTWPEAECVEAPQAEYSQAEKSATSEISAETTSPSLPGPSLPASHEPCGVSHHSTGERRCGEVRIGSVMIRLLKRYGITDAEINEGLADYAKKTCQSIAS